MAEMVEIDGKQVVRHCVPKDAGPMTILFANEAMRDLAASKGMSLGQKSKIEGADDDILQAELVAS